MIETPPSVLWEVAARLVLLSDTHVGSADPAHRRADEPWTGLPVDRAPDTGLPRLRATTLAGILRHDLVARTGDIEAAGTLFGTSAADDAEGTGVPGVLDLDDAEGHAPTAVTSRTGNRVDPASGTALPGHLWRREILPAGTEFILHLRVHVAEPAPASGPQGLDQHEEHEQQEAELLGLLVRCAAGLHQGPAARKGSDPEPAGAGACALRPGPEETGADCLDRATEGHGDAGVCRAPNEPGAPGVHHGPAGPGAPVRVVHRDASARGGAAPDPAGSRDPGTGPGTGPDDADSETPGLYVGARTGRGHGAIAATAWTARRHDLTTAEGWFAHHARTWEQRHTHGERALDDGSPTLAEALSHTLRTAGRPELADGIPTAVPDRRHRDELRLTLAVGEPDDPLLPARVRPGLLMLADPPPPDRVGAVDRVHRHRPVEGAPEPAPVLGDTALHALLKRLSARLARDACEALGGHEDLWRHWHAHWWGGDTDPATALPRPSRVRLRRTAVITGGAPLTTTRLTVDSLFGDAVDGHLSTSDVHCGGTAGTVLDVYEPDDSVRGLLALLVRDLATVSADTLGSGAGSGHGRLTATSATLTFRTGDGGPARTVDLLTAVRAPDSADARLVRGWVSRWHARLAPRTAGEGER